MWIFPHVAKRQRFDRVAVGGIEVHVLFVAVGLEEVVARPTIGKRRQLALIEFKLDFFSGAKDCKFVIELREQRKNVAVARVFSSLPRVWARAAYLLVNVFHVAWRLVFNLARIAMKAEIGFRQWHVAQGVVFGL